MLLTELPQVIPGFAVPKVCCLPEFAAGFCLFRFVELKNNNAAVEKSYSKRGCVENGGVIIGFGRSKQAELKQRPAFAEIGIAVSRAVFERTVEHLHGFAVTAKADQIHSPQDIQFGVVWLNAQCPIIV